VATTNERDEPVEEPASGSPPDLTAGDILFGLAVPIFLFDLVVCLVWGRVLVPFVLVAFLLLFGLGGRSLFAKVCFDVAVPVAIGLTIVSLALLGLNRFNDWADPADVESVQRDLAQARLTIDEWTALSLWRLVILATVLVALVALIGNLRPVERVKQALAGLSLVQAVLIVLTSVAVYAQVPMQKALDKTHGEIASEYRASLENEAEHDAARAGAEAQAEAETASAQTVRALILSPTAAEQRELRALLASIDKRAVEVLAEQKKVGTPVNLRVPMPNIGNATAAIVRALFGVTSSVGTVEAERSPVKDLPSRRAERALVLRAPETREELERQERALEEQRRREQGSEAEARQAQDRPNPELAEVRRLTIAKLASLAVPGNSDVAELIVDALIDRLAERFRPGGASARGGEPGAPTAAMRARAKRLLLPVGWRETIERATLPAATFNPASEYWLTRMRNQRLDEIRQKESKAKGHRK
jgi:hypothetical protein